MTTGIQQLVERGLSIPTGIQQLVEGRTKYTNRYIAVGRTSE